MRNQFEIKIRKHWGNLNPIERIHGEGKQGFKPKYCKKDRKNWKRNLDY
jgi:hypothetical protein